MSTSITAVFEAGLLRPTTPLLLAEGARVRLIIVGDEKSAQPAGNTAASILAGIAALPASPGNPLTSLIHDQILYGEAGSP